MGISKKNKVILAQPWGGLGDNLQYSNLPKLFNDIGKKFYVSHANHVRNKNIYKFCWQSNPYSNGKIFKKPNIGWKVWIDNLNTFKDKKGKKHMVKIELESTGYRVGIDTKWR